jgi:hypothetical protein
MKFLFDDEEFSFETLRTTGFAAYGGADLGEVLTTARHIGEGDEASEGGRGAIGVADRCPRLGVESGTSAATVTAV